MNVRAFLKALAVKTFGWGKIGKRLARSYVSLFLVIILSVTSTFAWFWERQAATIHSEELEFQSASSLRINKDKAVGNIIHIDDAIIDEASSVDGRNIYFPLGASFTTNTAEMLFREANAGDRILGDETAQIYADNPEMIGHYIYKDFELKGTSGNTPVYIKSYKIVVATDFTDGVPTIQDDGVDGIYEDQLEINYDANGVPQSQNLPPDDCPIRLAFISDSAKTPIVIDPSAQVIDYVENSDAVTLIDDNGVPTTQHTNADSFASYYYGKHPLFTIPGGQNLPVTLVVWLEGTMGNSDKYIGKKISIDIDIESNFAEMETIKFIDDTTGDTDSNVHHWVDNDGCILACSYEDPFSEETPKRWKTIIMTKTKERTGTGSGDEGSEWECQIPKKAVSKIAFYRLSWPSKKTTAGGNPSSTDPHGTILNAWHTSPDITNMLHDTAIPDSWFTGGDRGDGAKLDKTRQMTDTDGNKYNALTYTALHGNNNSTTTASDKRLAPGVGYWDYTPGGGTPAPTQAPTQSGGGGGSSGSTASIGVYVNTGNQTWIDTNCRSNGSHLYFKTANGGKHELSLAGSNYFSATVSLDVDDEITQFSIENSNNSEYRTWDASPTFKVISDYVTGGYNVTYSVNNDNNKMTR